MRSRAARLRPRRPQMAERSGANLVGAGRPGPIAGARPFEIAASLERQVREAAQGGTPVSAKGRAGVENRLGSSLGDVRLHRDAEAASLSGALGASAFTFGRHIFMAGRGGVDQRLVAHELAHAAQQQGAGEGGFVQRQEAPAEEQQQQQVTPPSQITFNFTGSIPVPPVGTRTLEATADQPNVTWSLGAGTAAVASGTTISNTGTIAVGAAQAAGTVNVTATNAGGSWIVPIRFAAHPTGIDSTSAVNDAPTGDYGHFFDHVLTSSTGNVADLQGVAVGERFPNLATPNAATHVIPNPPFPFGPSFTLSTATLTPDASNNWFLTAAGGLGGSLDQVTIANANINVGMFVQSASNPTPANRLPAGFTVDQHLFWYNPLEATAANRWTDFVTVGHSRFLTNSGGTLSFETTVNGVSDGGDSYVGSAAVTNLTASPVNIPKSAGPPSPGTPAPAARTVSLTVDTLPSSLPTGQALTWSIQGNALGCTIAADPANPAAAMLTIGTTAGTVRVRVAVAGSSNFDETTVRIT